MASIFYQLLYILPVLAQPPWQNWSGFGDMTDCGQGCFIQNIRASGCQFPNFGCVCATEDFIPNLTTCANSQCNATETEQILQAANSLCSSVEATSSVRTSVRTSARALESSTRTQNSRPTFSTSTTRSNTQSDDSSTTTGSGANPPTSETSPPSQTQSASATANGTTTSIGAVVGGVVGGFGGISLILAMVWLIIRERNRGASTRGLPPLMSQSPHTDQVEDQSQSIWDGTQAYKWNPRPRSRTNSTAELPAG